MRRSRNSSPRTSSSMNKGLLSVDEALGQLLAGAAPVSAVEEVPALEASGGLLARAPRARIFTGAPVPSGADAVVIQEETEAVDDSVVVKKKPGPGDWVRYVGS